MDSIRVRAGHAFFSYRHSFGPKISDIIWGWRHTNVTCVFRITTDKPCGPLPQIIMGEGKPWTPLSSPIYLSIPTPLSSSSSSQAHSSDFCNLLVMTFPAESHLSPPTPGSSHNCHHPSPPPLSTPAESNHHSQTMKGTTQNPFHFCSWVDSIFQRWSQQYLLSHILFLHMTLTFPINQWFPPIES